MTKAKHTPGLWHAEGCTVIADDGTKYHRMKQIAGTVQMQHGDLHPEDVANAQFMATAPELLSSCKEMREAMAAAFRVMEYHGSAWHDFYKECAKVKLRDGFGKRAEAAIERAEGKETHVG